MKVSSRLFLKDTGVKKTGSIQQGSSKYWLTKMHDQYLPHNVREKNGHGLTLMEFIVQKRY